MPCPVSAELDDGSTSLVAALSLVRACRRGDLTSYKRATAMGPAVEMRIGRWDVIAMAEKAGLKVTAEHDLLEHQYFIELMAR